MVTKDLFFRNTTLFPSVTILTSRFSSKTRRQTTERIEPMRKTWDKLGGQFEGHSSAYACFF
jgi:hypothetical protein